MKALRWAGINERASQPEESNWLAPTDPVIYSNPSRDGHKDKDWGTVRLRPSRLEWELRLWPASISGPRREMLIGRFVAAELPDPRETTSATRGPLVVTNRQINVP